MNSLHKVDLIPIKKWNNFHALALLLAGVLSIYFHTPLFVAITGGCSFLALVISQNRFLAQYTPWAGYANLVTLFRLIILIITAGSFHLLSPLLLFFILGTLIALDVLDGHLARKLSLESDLGLYLDMESDALFVCLVSFILYFGELMPIWILIVGSLRYMNVFVFFLFNLKPRKEPKRKYASYIAGFLFMALLSPFILSKNIYFPILSLASILVTFSFIISFIQYLGAEEI
ncbi:MAG: phosphatidylglycerophosphate synthase [Maribacter sp.]|jgi:phosphatidylglycerophosphate synthase